MGRAGWLGRLAWMARMAWVAWMAGSGGLSGGVGIMSHLLRAETSQKLFREGRPVDWNCRLRGPWKASERLQAKRLDWPPTLPDNGPW
jgi:hypothetical protein